MALDYYLEIKGCGSENEKKLLCDLVRREFGFSNSENENIITNSSLTVSFFLDDEVDDGQGDTPALSINFRVSKGKLEKQGYILLRQVVEKISGAVDTDLYLTDEYEEDVFLERVSGNVVKSFTDHDVWQVGRK